ncbi:MAG: hypothetical protein NC932_00925 [Candidatus Omnitrophica bacterium]|nr:hypothetical protein [Candidatus Omnitrophota bacterium]
MEDDAKLLERLEVNIIRRVVVIYVGPEGIIPSAGINTILGKDIFGVVLKPKQHPTGVYNELPYHTLANAKTMKKIEKYNWPSVDWLYFSHLKYEISEINRNKRYAIMF